MSLNKAVRHSSSGNPVSGHPFFVNPFYISNLRRTVFYTKGPEKLKLIRNLNVPTAFWLDSKESIHKGRYGTNAETVLNLAAYDKRKPLVTFIIYNLPNRDCAANASAGEICCSYNANGTCNYVDTSNKCEDGIREYKKEYISPLAGTIQHYCDKVPMAFVIEPDSLPNLITNLENPRCGNPATKRALRRGIKYAVQKLNSVCSKAPIYVDAAHGAWLGWEDNSVKFLEEIKKMKIASHLRGFSLNVANYQEMGTLCPQVGTCNPESETRNHTCCKADACDLASTFNPGFTILNYAASLKEYAKIVLPEMDVHYLLDTGRNGVANAREECGNWCNVRGAGFGLRPTTKTAAPGMIDAYMWLKPPGECDGCTKRLPDGKRCPRFDEACASVDSVGSRKGEPRAPEAGDWFAYYLRLMARNS